MTKSPETTREIAKQAERAHNDLNIFAGVVALMEHGLTSSDSQADQFVIIRRAQAAQQRCLRRYDAAHAKLALKPQ